MVPPFASTRAWPITFPFPPWGNHRPRQFSLPIGRGSFANPSLAMTVVYRESSCAVPNRQHRRSRRQDRICRGFPGLRPILEIPTIEALREDERRLPALHRRCRIERAPAPKNSVLSSWSDLFLSPRENLKCSVP